ncbi:hypothetical protein [Dactylosporangium sp. NPDC000521]|uniref:hypothetical protein n=1 Tax=Dactylosporangium sp. NPDC000521 TaxID=3363975 RepID=UPI0036C87F58
MSLVHSRLVASIGAGAAAATLLSAAAVLGAPSVAGAAPTATAITVVSPAGGKVAADTTRQVVTINVAGLTGATLDDASIQDVYLGDNCQSLDFYVTPGTTQLVVRTPDPGGCAPTSGVASETITINFANGVGALTKTLSGLVFITPPDLDTTAPVITDLSSELPAANRIKQFMSTGNQVIRVKAGSGFSFSGAAGQLSATLGGKPLAEIKVYKTDGTVTTAAGSNAENGNWFTGKTSTGMTNGNLVITHRGVSKTFLAADLGTSVVTLPVITGVTPLSSKSNTSVTVTLSGTFTGATGVTFCGVAGTNFTLNSASTSITVKTPTTGIADDAAGLGAGVFSGVCPIKVVTPAGSNVHTAKSILSFLAE